MKYHRLCLLIALAPLALAVRAETPRDVDDLVDIRASAGDRELEERGYRHHKTIDGKHGSIDYWWNRHDKQCIAVNVKEGRFVAITGQPEAMCGGQGSSERDSDRHHDRRGDNLDDLKDMRVSSGERELEDMGYRHYRTIDGKNGSIDYWWSRRDAQCIAVNVKDGHFIAVTKQPETMCGENGSGDHDRDSHHDRRGGNLDDLKDMRVSSGERELEDMGYRHYKTIDGKNGSIDYWWNRYDDQCVAVNVNDGRFVAITKQPEAMCGR